MAYGGRLLGINTSGVCQPSNGSGSLLKRLGEHPISGPVSLRPFLCSFRLPAGRWAMVIRSGSELTLSTVSLCLSLKGLSLLFTQASCFFLIKQWIRSMLVCTPIGFRRKLWDLLVVSVRTATCMWALKNAGPGGIAVAILLLIVLIWLLLRLSLLNLFYGGTEFCGIGMSRKKFSVLLGSYWRIRSLLWITMCAGEAWAQMYALSV